MSATTQISGNKIYRFDYTPPPCQIPFITLSFVLDGKNTVVEASQEIVMEAWETQLKLHGVGFETLYIHINDRPIPEEDIDIQGDYLSLKNLPAQFILTTKVKLDPDHNSQLMGLYRSGGIYCTQCEAEGFRRISWSMDRPDISSRYKVNITARKQEAPILLSNGNLTDETQLEDGWHQACFDDPFPKPCFLFALVAGKLEGLFDRFTTQSGREISLALWAKPGQAQLGKHALNSLIKAMKWEEQCYGLEYDLNIFNIVAVDDFNFGAMENKSLNVFNAKYVLADPAIATDSDYKIIESIVAHEYFHNWTGNRVTCRDWFQLSLKEGLTVFRDQSFSADMHDPAVERIEQVMGLRRAQFSEDAGPLAHSVRPDFYEQINNFYTATIYEKGAEIVRMLHTILGEAGFQKGMKLYFKRHDGSAATCDDFIRAMADANHVDLDDFAAWYGQIGTPKVDVRWERDTRTARLRLYLKQTTPHLPNGVRALEIPFKMSLLNVMGRPMNVKWRQLGDTAWHNPSDKSVVLPFDQSQMTFEFDWADEFHLPSLNQNLAAPIIVNAPFKDKDLLFLLQYDQDALVRYDAIAQLYRRLILEQDDVALEEHSLFRDFCNAYLRVFNHAKTSPALRATLLSFPSARELYLGLPHIDVDKIHIRLQTLKSQLADALHDSLLKHYLALYHACQTAEDQYNADCVGKRQFYNFTLHLLAADPKQRALDLIKAHYDNAANMTDRIAGLSALISHGRTADKIAALAHYEQEFQNFAPAMDRFYALQAGNSACTLSDIKDLTQRADFNPLNPNRARSLYGAFAMNNIVHFHDQDGAGYHFIADFILEIDSKNAMLASMLVSAFGDWRRLDQRRQNHIKQALTRIVEHKGLSSDCRERVEKTL
ncbi:MAG: aminopeptidase N [Alphaproteobacteria bacterium]